MTALVPLEILLGVAIGPIGRGYGLVAAPARRRSLESERPAGNPPGAGARVHNQPRSSAARAASVRVWVPVLWIAEDR